MVAAPVDHKKVYAAVPPPTFAVTLPLVEPKQLICDPLLLLVTAAVTVTALAGWVIVTQATLRQLFASLTVTQCCPAARPVLVAVVVPFAQRKVYGAVPPEPATVAEPVDCPKQFTLTTVPALIVAVTALGCVNVTVAVAVQPLASVVVTRYVPAASPLSVCVVAVVDHAKPYGVVPPAGLAVTDPSDEPKQLICDPL